jgi:hypothetical protein
MPPSDLTVDDSGQVYSMPAFVILRVPCVSRNRTHNDGPDSFRLAAQEGFSKGFAHLLAPDQTRLTLQRLLLFSVNAL